MPPVPPSATASSPTPSLTERRKAATQLDIARAAAALFREHGPDGTTAEDIARRAGVAPRTFYRYFRSKQDAVAPLLTAGADRWHTSLAAARPGPPAALPETLERAVRDALSVPDGRTAEGFHQTRALLRAAAGDPALRAVWYRVNRESEERLAPLVARLLGAGADPLAVRLTATVATDAIRVAMEAWAETDAPVEGPGSPAELAARCLRHLLPPGSRIQPGPGSVEEGGDPRPAG